MNYWSRCQGFFTHTHPYFWRHPLWRRNNWAPYLRFAQLQALFFLGRRKVLVPWMDGLLLPIEKGDYGLTGNYYLGMQEFKDMAFMLHLLRRGDLFVDIGANVGSYSLLAAGSAHAVCLSFEPVPQTYQRLLSAVAVNNLGELVSTRNLALASPEKVASGPSSLFSGDRDATNSFVGEDYAGTRIVVGVQTLDVECALLSPVLIKMDVEGYERDVLLGSKDTLAKDSMMAVIIEGQSHEVNAILREAGYLDFSYDPMARKLTPVAHYTINRIWIKEGKLPQVEQRVAAAPKRSVYGSSF